MRKRPKTGDAISVEAAALLCAFVALKSNPNATAYGFNLALRGSVDMREFLGFSGSRDTFPPASKEQVKEFLTPFLKSAVEVASWGRMLDSYIWDPTPDDVVFASYAITRWCVAREREPSASEKKLIWEWTVRLAKGSYVAGKYWSELEKENIQKLDAWVAYLKEAARKRYETFLRQKRSIDATAAEAFDTLISIFG
jgi:hypothetical protein